MRRSFRLRNSIVNMLTLNTILLLVLATLVISFVAFWISYDTQRNEVLRGLEKTALQAASGISSHLNLAFNTLNVFIGTQEPSDLIETPQFSSLSRFFHQHLSFFSGLSILDAQGQELFRESTFRIFPTSELVNRADSPEFQAALRGETYVGPIRISAQSNVPVTTLGVPFHTPTGVLEGVLVAEVTLKEMWDIVSEIEFGVNGYVYVVDTTGKLRAFGELTEIYQLFDQDLMHIPEVERFVAKIPWAVGQQHEYVGLREIEVIGSYAPIQNTDWGVIVELPTDEAFEGVQRMIVLQIFALIGVMVMTVFVSPLMLRKIRVDLDLLRLGAEQLGSGNLENRIILQRQDELGILAQVFNSMTDRIQALIMSLEQRVTERTRDLERRSVQFQTSAEVGQAVASIRDLDQLLSQVTHLVSERFGFYHVGIFLLDAGQEYAVLRATNSEGGQRMLARNHRLKVGQRGIVGYVTKERKARIALDVGADAVFFDNPDLPDTHSEMALPLIVRDQLLGALDVQSIEPEAFTEEDVAVLRVLADQVAIAIENANLFAEGQEALAVARRAYGELARESWLQLLQNQTESYVSRPTGTSVVASHWRPEMIQASHQGRTIQAEHGDVVVPIINRGQPLGVVRLRKPVDAGQWTPEEIDLAEALGDQLSVAFESARLYQDSLRRAAREQTLGAVTGRIRESLQLEDVLRVAASEIRTAMGLDKIVVRLATPETAANVELEA